MQVIYFEQGLVAPGVLSQGVGGCLYPVCKYWVSAKPATVIQHAAIASAVAVSVVNADMTLLRLLQRLVEELRGGASLIQRALTGWFEGCRFIRQSVSYDTAY